MDWVLSRFLDQRHNAASVGSTKTADNLVPNDTVTLEALHTVTYPLGHSHLDQDQVSKGLLDEIMQPVHVCREDTEILGNFT